MCARQQNQVVYQEPGDVFWPSRKPGECNDCFMLPFNSATTIREGNWMISRKRVMELYALKLHHIPWCNVYLPTGSSLDQANREHLVTGSDWGQIIFTPFGTATIWRKRRSGECWNCCLVQIYTNGLDQEAGPPGLNHLQQTEHLRCEVTCLGGISLFLYCLKLNRSCSFIPARSRYQISIIPPGLGQDNKIT